MSVRRSSGDAYVHAAHAARHEDTALVEGSLPRSWEEPQSFQEALFEWMERAPWLAISAAAHVLVFLILTLIPWGIFGEREEKPFVAKLQPETVEEFVQPPPEEDEVDEPEIDPDEPVVQSEDVPEEIAEDSDNLDEEPAAGESDLLMADAFDTDFANPILGIGPGGGKYGGRFDGKGRGRHGRGNGTEIPIANGLDWLVRHQDEDGGWDSEGFAKHDPARESCFGPGQPEHDVGVTGLALLALLGNGNTTTQGLYRENVTRGIRWLTERQDSDTGLVGQPIGSAYMYDHAIATLALCEAYYFSKSPILRRRAQDAVSLITRARNPYGAWRYDVRPNGENDTSVTGWMVLALESAREAGLTVDSEYPAGALGWLDEVTDRGSGRVGYTAVGSPSSRVTGVNDHYPVDRTEAMTAVGLLSRVFLGQEPEEQEVMRKHADLLLRALPEWDPDGLSNDMYYWYYGSYAMYQMGGRHWKAWSKAMTPAVLESQREDGCAKGSWDPIGPWGHAGGRVYSTALGVLCLQAYFRYSRLVTGR